MFLTAFLLFLFALIYSIPMSAHRLMQLDRYLFNARAAFLISAIAMFALFGNALIAYSLLSMPPSSAHLIQRSETIFTILLGVMFLKERGLLALSLSILLFSVGLYVMNQSAFEQFDAELFPLLAAIGSALCFTAMQGLARMLLPVMSSHVINTARLLLLVIALSFLFPDLLNQLRVLPREAFIQCALAAFFGPFIGRLAYMNASRYIGIAKTALSASLSPIYTLVLQILLTSIVITANQWIGSFLLILAVSLPALTKACKHLPKIPHRHTK